MFLTTITDKYPEIYTVNSGQIGVKMGLKKRSKVSAEFNMSSLTDIIFLLLIFFMLTSTLVAPNAINLKLPSSSNAPSTVKPSDLDDVRVNRSGQYYFNQRRVSKSQLATSMKNTKRKGGRNATITLSPDTKATHGAVIYVMDLANQLNIDAVLTVSAN